MVQYLSIAVWFYFYWIVCYTLSKDVLPYIKHLWFKTTNSRARWQTELGSHYNYLSVATNDLQSVPWEFFIFTGSIPFFSRTFCCKWNFSLSAQLVIHKTFLRRQLEEVCMLFFCLLSAVWLSGTKVLSWSHVLNS